MAIMVRMTGMASKQAQQQRQLHASASCLFLPLHSSEAGARKSKEKQGEARRKKEEQGKKTWSKEEKARGRGRKGEKGRQMERNGEEWRRVEEQERGKEGGKRTEGPSLLPAPSSFLLIAPPLCSSSSAYPWPLARAHPCR